MEIPDKVCRQFSSAIIIGCLSEIKRLHKAYPNLINAKLNITNNKSTLTSIVYASDAYQESIDNKCIDDRHKICLQYIVENGANLDIVIRSDHPMKPTVGFYIENQYPLAMKFISFSYEVNKRNK